MSNDSVSAFLRGLTFPSQSIAESVIAKVVGEQISVTQLKTLTDEEFEELEIIPDVATIIREGFQRAEVFAHLISGLVAACLSVGIMMECNNVHGIS